MPDTLPIGISRLPSTAPSRSFLEDCRPRRESWCHHPPGSITIISCSHCYSLLNLQQISSEIHLIVANRRTDRVGLTGHFGRGHLPLPRPHFRMPRSRQYAMRFCLFCDAYDSNEAGGISSRLFIDAPLGFGDRAPWRARRGTDRCSAVPPCVWRGGDG